MDELMNAKATSTLKLRRIKYKDGRSIEVFPGPSRNEIGARMARAAGVMASDPTITGYAIVTWGSSPEGFGNWRNQAWAIGRDSVIGETTLPTFVHDVLFRDICDPTD